MTDQPINALNWREYMLPRYAGGVERRQNYPSEVMYYAQNPHVAGMAAEDDKITLNPFSPNSASGQRAVMNNEAARVHMRTNALMKPQFDPTQQQMNALGGYGSPDDIRQTVAARIYSGDPSAGDASPSQVSFVNRLRNYMGGQ